MTRRKKERKEGRKKQALMAVTMEIDKMKMTEDEKEVGGGEERKK